MDFDPIATMNARHDAKREQPRSADNPPTPKDWVEEIEQRIAKARYSGENVVTNAEAVKIIAELRRLQNMP